jgi:transcriptional regulator with XRE-family HTH domain
MDEIQEAPQIGPVLQRQRKARRLTLEQLAARSGVSRSMLSQIERGEANPTFAVLWGLTQALGVDLAELVAGGAVPRHTGAIEITTAAHTPEIGSPDGAWKLKILSPPSLAGRVEWYEVDLAAKAKLQSAAHAPGTIEHLTAWTEGLSVTAGDLTETLRRGETARYRADVAHEIANSADAPARALMVVMYD